MQTGHGGNALIRAGIAAAMSRVIRKNKDSHKEDFE